MTKVSREINRKRLRWVGHARDGVLSAIGDVVKPTFQVFPTVDPIRFILKIALNRPLAKATRPHLRTYLRCWAQEFECDIPVIRITDQRVQAEVLTKQRHWNRNSKGMFTKGKRNRFGKE